MVKTCRVKERKDRRANLLFKASVYEDFQKIAYVKSMSVNALIGTLVEDYVKSHQEEVKKYNREVVDSE